jgi:transcriptional regulator with XRE-family HTH domain
MIFGFGMKNKTVRELRKNRGYTAAELARRLKVDTIEILHVDDLKLKDVAEPLYNKLIPVLRGDDYDRIPW